MPEGLFGPIQRVQLIDVPLTVNVLVPLAKVGHVPLTVGSIVGFVPDVAPPEPPLPPEPLPPAPLPPEELPP
jgi:hypothetical protein